MVCQFKYRRSDWHQHFRTIDDLCLSIRLIHHLQSVEKGKKPDGDDNITQDLIDTEEAVIMELVDMLKREFSPQSNGVRDIGNEALRIVAEPLNTAPVAWSNYFTFGILYLMQELVGVLNPGKFSVVVDHALHVAQYSTDENLQLKAFELLAALDRREKQPEWLKYKINAFLSSQPPNIKDRAEMQWDLMTERVFKMESYCEKLKRPYFNIRPQTTVDLPCITANCRLQKF